MKTEPENRSYFPASSRTGLALCVAPLDFVGLVEATAAFERLSNAARALGMGEHQFLAIVREVVADAKCPFSERRAEVRRRIARAVLEASDASP